MARRRFRGFGKLVSGETDPRVHKLGRWAARAANPMTGMRERRELLRRVDILNRQLAAELALTSAFCAFLERPDAATFAALESATAACVEAYAGHPDPAVRAALPRLVASLETIKACKACGPGWVWVWDG